MFSYPPSRPEVSLLGGLCALSKLHHQYHMCTVYVLSASCPAMESSAPMPCVNFVLEQPFRLNRLSGTNPPSTFVYAAQFQNSWCSGSLSTRHISTSKGALIPAGHDAEQSWNQDMPATVELPLSCRVRPPSGSIQRRAIRQGSLR